jgi:hypothetical protein
MASISRKMAAMPRVCSATVTIVAMLAVHTAAEPQIARKAQPIDCAPLIRALNEPELDSTLAQGIQSSMPIWAHCALTPCRR